MSHSTSVASNAHKTSNWPHEYSRSSSISSGSYYPSSEADLEVEEVFEQAEEHQPIVGRVTITDFSEDEGEKTPIYNKGRVNMADVIKATEMASERSPYPTYIQERPPPAVAMARRPSYEERPFSRPQPPRPASRAESGARPRTHYYEAPPQPPRPASRASTSSAAFEFEGQQRRAAAKAMLQSDYRSELSRSPSGTSAAISEATNKLGRCPHCKIHSWLPHSPNCPKKK